jgi:hypothetical protein
MDWIKGEFIDEMEAGIADMWRAHRLGLWGSFWSELGARR